MIIISIIFIFSLILTLILISTPLMIGISIIMVALRLACLFASLFRSWYAFLIFLIYVGGILVIFAYFVSLVPNQKTDYKKHAKFILLTFFFLILLKIIINWTPVILVSAFSINSLYLHARSPILFFIVVLLLITIVIIVKITNRTAGPLRPFSYV
jgi:NADH-ubiquinone oxidoreductase chain 6